MEGDATMKDKQKSIALGVVAFLVLAFAPGARGLPFTNPPELNLNITWQTTFPYQRNIFLDFSVNPVGAPGSGIPGADYEGYDDPVLKASDFVELVAGEWLAGGTIRLDPSGFIKLHLDNWDRGWPVKHLYAEWTGTGEIAVDVDFQGGDYQVVNVWQGTNAVWYEFQPNPPWEELYFFNNGTDHATLDNLHIATECVPVPTAVLLAVLGLGVAGLRLRKFV
jgi:hypothetical protein